MLLDGRAQESGIKRRSGDATILLLYNAHFDIVDFTLPAVPEGKWWERLMPDVGLESFSFGGVYAMTGRSFVALGLSALSRHVA
jgi:isoamylase